MSADADDDFDDDPFLSSSPSIHEDEVDFGYVYAMKKFDATEPGQVHAQKGDVMILINDSNSYWWLVRHVKDSSVGFLPAEIIELPLERLARLNKHRNGDASMNSDPSATPKSTFSKIFKSSKKKDGRNVSFKAHSTYISASEYEWSEEDTSRSFVEDDEEIDDHHQDAHGDARVSGEPDGSQHKPTASSPASIRVHSLSEDSDADDEGDYDESRESPIDIDKPLPDGPLVTSAPSSAGALVSDSKGVPGDHILKNDSVVSTVRPLSHHDEFHDESEQQILEPPAQPEPLPPPKRRSFLKAKSSVEMLNSQQREKESGGERTSFIGGLFKRRRSHKSNHSRESNSSSLTVDSQRSNSVASIKSDDGSASISSNSSSLKNAPTYHSPSDLRQPARSQSQDQSVRQNPNQSKVFTKTETSLISESPPTSMAEPSVSPGPVESANELAGSITAAPSAAGSGADLKRTVTPPSMNALPSQLALHDSSVPDLSNRSDRTPTGSQTSSPDTSPMSPDASDSRIYKETLGRYPKSTVVKVMSPVKQGDSKVHSAPSGVSSLGNNYHKVNQLCKTGTLNTSDSYIIDQNTTAPLVLRGSTSAPFDLDAGKNGQSRHHDVSTELNGRYVHASSSPPQLDDRGEESTSDREESRTPPNIDRPVCDANTSQLSLRAGSEMVHPAIEAVFKESEERLDRLSLKIESLLYAYRAR